MNTNVYDQPYIDNTSHIRQYLILFLIWPFLAFLLAIKNYSQREAKKVVFLFIIYYGLSFVLTHIGTDSEEYARRLIINSKLPFSDFFKIVGGLNTTDTSVDIVEPLISFVVSRFTNFHGVYFAIWAAFFGFFYLKSANLLYDRYRIKPDLNAAIMMIFFILILPPTSMNGPRMWTAAWVFFYGAYHVVLYRDSRYLFVTLASSLVHFSFLSANAILFIYYFAGNRNFIYTSLLILSFVLPHLVAPYFRSISNIFGGAIQGRYEGYTNEEYILGIQQSYKHASWFLTLSNDLVFYFLLLALAIIQIKNKHLMNEKSDRNLFSFLLLFLAFVNFGKDIPSLGKRFQIIFFLFATLYIFLFFLKQPGNKFKLLALIGLFPMALNAALTFRLGAENISAWIFAPGLGLSLLAPSLSLANLLFH